MIGETNKKEQQGFVKSLKVPVTEAKIGLFQVAMEMLVLLAIVQFLIILFATTRLTNSLNLAKREITELEEKLKDSQLVQIKEQVNNIGSRLSLLQKLSQKITSHEEFWAELEQTMVSGSGYTSVGVDKDGAVTLSGKTVNYEALAKLISSLKSSSKFSDIKLTQSSSDGKLKSFSLSLKFNKIQQKEVTNSNETSQNE